MNSYLTHVRIKSKTNKNLWIIVHTFAPWFLDNAAENLRNSKFALLKKV